MMKRTRTGFGGGSRRNTALRKGATSKFSMHPSASHIHRLAPLPPTPPTRRAPYARNPATPVRKSLGARMPSAPHPVRTKHHGRGAALVEAAHKAAGVKMGGDITESDSDSTDASDGDEWEFEFEDNSKGESGKGKSSKGDIERKGDDDDVVTPPRAAPKKRGRPSGVVSDAKKPRGGGSKMFAPARRLLAGVPKKSGSKSGASTSRSKRSKSTGKRVTFKALEGVDRAKMLELFPELPATPISVPLFESEDAHLQARSETVTDRLKLRRAIYKALSGVHKAYRDVAPEGTTGEVVAEAEVVSQYGFAATFNECVTTKKPPMAFPTFVEEYIRQCIFWADDLIKSPKKPATRVSQSLHRVGKWKESDVRAVWSEVIAGSPISDERCTDLTPRERQWYLIHALDVNDLEKLYDMLPQWFREYIADKSLHVSTKNSTMRAVVRDLETLERTIGPKILGPTDFVPLGSVLTGSGMMNYGMQIDFDRRSVTISISKLGVVRLNLPYIVHRMPSRK